MIAGRLILLVAVLFLGANSAAWSFGLRDAAGNPTGNKHDFSSTNGQPVSATSDTRVCVFCHTPHNASGESVLWNRGFPATFGSFPLYGGNIGGVAIRDDATIKANSGYGGSDYPNGASRMCLSCHDGATALNNILTGGFIDMTFATLDDYITPGVNDGLHVDLAVSHPISFKYDGTIPSQVDAFHVALSDGLRYQSTSDPVNVPLDPQGRMQCTTCHDPHDDTSAAIGLPFWRHDATASPYNDVCNACHSSGVPDLGVGGTDHNINR